MSTLATLRTKASRALRDPQGATFDNDDLNDLINQGITELSRFFPREAVDSSVTLTVAVNSYTTSVAFTKIYRVDRYRTGLYQETLPVNTGDGPNSGWEWHAAALWLPPARTWTSGDTLAMFGYAGYAQLMTDDAEPTFDATGESAIIVFCQVEGFLRLLDGRSAFQQWQASPGNTDVTALSMAQIYAGAQRRWEEQKQSLRRMRKTS